MVLMHDYLLVQEVIPNITLGDSNLKFKYDDSERFMYVKIVDKSPMLLECYMKEYPKADIEYLKSMIDKNYATGNVLIINRVAKTPYREGLYFISYKDVICVEDSSAFSEVTPI